MAPIAQPKSKVVAAILALFLGCLGAHNFYLGYTTRGIIELVAFSAGVTGIFIVIGFVILPVLGIWVFIEFIMILVGSGNYAHDSYGLPLV